MALYVLYVAQFKEVLVMWVKALDCKSHDWGTRMWKMSEEPLYLIQQVEFIFSLHLRKTESTPLIDLRPSSETS